jgi:predicted ATPase/DNA-binding CsgD family transcriptional regulator/Tfp pilus assembly protein PilF
MTSEFLLPVGNLPAEPNSFIGRERDLAELSGLLCEVRALTLCGPGGVGKTRLAIRLARRLTPDFPAGLWLIELADTTDAAGLVRRVATTLGIREERHRLLSDTLGDVLRQRRALLILDTCDHLVADCAGLVSQLLATCPELRIIATSRQPLKIRGETTWRVPPLDLPQQAGPGERADLAGHEAVRLFSDRAAAARPSFAVGADNAAAVAHICGTLDGMPLAIELAAARVRTLSVDQIAARLDDRFRLLASGDRTAPPRQQTLRAAVEWSYGLLTEAEQVLLRRLSVFSGWNLEMAEQVAADEVIPVSEVLGLLATLIDKSLVILDGELNGTTRYRLLDTIREYAAGRLTDSGEGAALRGRHRDYLLGLAEQTVRQAFARGDPPWPVRVALYHRVGAERANYRLALAECVARGDLAEGLRICCALRAAWVSNGDIGEGVGWFDQLLRPDGDVPAELRARALIRRAELAFEQQDYPKASECARAGLVLAAGPAAVSCAAERAAGDAWTAAAWRVLALVSIRLGQLDEALARAEKAIAIARTAGDYWEEGLALNSSAATLARIGKLDEAQQAFEQALEVLRDNNGWGVAQTLYGLGSLARTRSDYPAALCYFGEALVLYRAIDARPDIARCLAGIGWVALARGDLDLASSHLSECLQLSLATGERLAIARVLEALAVLAAARGDHGRSAKLAGAALALREAAGQELSGPAGARLAEVLAAGQAGLGADRAAALLAEGRRMSPYDAARFATGESGARELPAEAAGSAAARTGTPGAESELTERQLQIAYLVARGLSNKQIATELVISPATVARHIANIFAQLGFRSRAQLAAWVAERESAPD